MGYEYHLFGDSAKVDHFHTQGVLDQTSTDIPEVGSAFTQIRIVQFRHHAGILLDGMMDGSFGREMFITDQPNDVGFQLFIFEQHQVAFEDRLFLFTECPSGHFLDSGKLLRGFLPCIEEAGNFCFNIFCADRVIVDDNLFFFQQQCLGECNTGGCQNS